MGCLWLVHWLPLGVQAALGRGLGALLHAAAGSRRQGRAAQSRAVLSARCRWRSADALAREHFRWLGRSILERGLLWWAPRERLKRLIHVEGDVTLAERSERPVMWLVPHFMALDVAGASVLLFQQRRGASIYQQQSNPVMDAVIRRGRLRLGNAEIFPRSDSAKPLMRAIKQGAAFFNLPDMDFGERDAAFVPFFGVPAATLLAPSRMARALNMVVQPVVAEMLPGGRATGCASCHPGTTSRRDDALADTARA